MNHVFWQVTNATRSIDPLHRLLHAGAEHEMIQPLPGRNIKADAIIFANPVQQEIEALMEIIHNFGEAAGHRNNM